MLSLMRRTTPPTTTPLWAVLLLTGLGSLGTGLYWFGLSFIARYGYGFEQDRNLLFHSLLGGVYVVGSLASGPLTSKLAVRWSTRAQLAGILVGQAAVVALPILLDAEVWLWIAACVVSVLSALMWPVVESYLGSGRQGEAMRKALAGFNLVWMPATLVPMFLMAPFIENHAREALSFMILTNLLSLFVLPKFRPNPKPHGVDGHFEEAGERYRYLLRASRYLLPTSYVLVSVLSPLLPYRLEGLGVPVEWQTPLTSVWMAARVLVLIVMWRLAAWHGRWSTLALAATTMSLGFVAVVLSPHLTGMTVGLALLGTGLGITYYAALYYALAVGQAEVEAGGTHEALIGLGYTLGPLIGWAGLALSGPGMVVVLTGALVAGATQRALKPYREEARGGH